MEDILSGFLMPRLIRSRQIQPQVLRCTLRWGFPMRIFIVALCLFSFSFQGNADTRTWPSKPWPSKRGKVIVQPFNLDEIATIKERGYEETNGQDLNGGGNDELWSQEYCVFNRDNFPARPVRLVSCVIVIKTMLRRDANGYPVWKNEDAIQIDFNGNILNNFDSGDTYCSSSLYPDWSVFAIGLWKSRKSPQVGGYAYSLRNAWVVVPETKKLKAIPTNSVKCEVNEDRD